MAKHIIAACFLALALFDFVESEPISTIDIAASLKLTSFTRAIDTAGYQHKLSHYFKGTVFAPSNAAFKVFAASLNLTEEAVLTNRPLMKHILSYHIVNTKVLEKQELLPLQTYATDLHQAYLTIYKSRYGPVRILFGELLLERNGFQYDGFASITKPDLATERAVLHMIDRVLVPPRGEVR